MIGRPSVTLTARAEGEQLHRHESLIVVAGDDAVELAAGRAHEHRVGRESGRVTSMARRARVGHGRREHVVVLAAR